MILPIYPAIEPIATPRDAVPAWRECYAGDEPGKLPCRLALGMLLYDSVFDAVAELADPLPPVRGSLSRMVELSHRVRVAPLVYVVEHDTDAAALVVRHPRAVPDLLRDQGDIFRDSDDPRLTPRAKHDLPAFLRKMKAIAPLLLDRVDVPRRFTEEFLRFIHTKPALDGLRKADSARDQLATTLPAFRRSLGPKVEPSPAGIDRRAIDNILWQVAFHLGRATAPDAKPWDAVGQKVPQRADKGAYKMAAAKADAAGVIDAMEAEHDWWMQPVSLEALDAHE